MRLGAEAMNAALADFKAASCRTDVASAYDVFLAMKWAAAHPADDPTGQSPWRAAADAVQQIFVVYPENPLGRLKPLHYDWLKVENSGRKTIWNNNTRGSNKLSATLLADRNIRNGLLPNASEVLSSALPPARPSWQSLAVLVLREHSFDESDTWSTARTELLGTLGMTQSELEDIASPDGLGVSLLGNPEWDADTIPEELRPPEATVVQASAAQQPSAGLLPAPVNRVSISVDTRVARMLRLALATASSILLVGPPGTGKGTLLKWALAEIASRPEDYGFDAGFEPNPLWRTPDESWSAFELIGGLAPDEHAVLRWSDGALLNALESDRWLILDETNRGDMDKIMGPLLTWLSDQEVEVGRSAAHGGVPIHIGWGEESGSTIDNSAETKRYLAGTKFRLLGTYNPQDAQRVFRFGQALSRRFVVIPVPAIRPGQFTQLLEESFPDLADTAVTAISGLYSAHFEDNATALGPAVFLRMARYLVAGLRVAPPAPASTAPVDSPELSGELDDVVETPLLPQLLAEAYVMGVGRYLAGYDESTFGELAERVITDESALPREQWVWVTAQRDVLS